MDRVTPSMENFQITFRDMSSTDALEARMRGCATRLLELFPKITRCRVALEAPRRRHRHGHTFRCRVDLVVPNAELVAQNPEESDASQDAYAVINDCSTRRRDSSKITFVARGGTSTTARRDAARARLQVRAGAGPGSRYGFLETHDGREIYFHEHSVLHGQFDKLEIGSDVRFAEEEGEKGPQASTVAVTKRRSTVTTTTADPDEIPDSPEASLKAGE